jgi:hypothetical protein
MEESIKESHPILQATELYADYLNSSSMTNHITNLLGSEAKKKKIEIIPYCYFQNKIIDYEAKKGTKYSDNLKNMNYDIKKIDITDDEDIIKYLVPKYKKLLPKNKSACGLIGVPIPNEEEPDAEQDHYVSYIYDNKTNILYYFDSAIDEYYKESETYKILIYTFKPDKVIRNKKTFETAGGVSDSPYTYIAQNIFCHSWSMWFLYQMIVENKTVTQLNNLKSTKNKSDKDNLIRIKKFVYNYLIDKLKLNILLDFSLFDAFRYIIIKNNPKKYEEIIH